MNTPKLKHFQVTVAMAAGVTSNDENFPTIDGAILGYSTVVLGMTAGKTADLEITNGSSTILDPIDLAVGNVANRTSVLGSIAPLYEASPGRVKAIIKQDVAVANGEDYSVKVIVYYDENSKNSGATKPAQCFQ